MTHEQSQTQSQPHHHKKIRLYKLGQSTASVLTLGEIKDCWVHDRSTINNSDIDWLWMQYDNFFAKRCDYLLWRRLVFNKYPSMLPLLDSTSIDTLVENGLDSYSEEEIWGTLSVIAGTLLSHKYGISDASRQQIITSCDNALSKNRRPLNKATIACSIITILIRSVSQTFYFKKYSVSDNYQYIKTHINNMQHNFRIVDPAWVPGKNLSWSPFTNERKTGRNLLAYPHLEIFLRLQIIMFNIRGLVRANIRIINEESADLLKLAFLYSLSAWKLCRGLRITWQLKDPKQYPESPMRASSLFASELKALQRCSQAARDRGSHYNSAALACLLLIISPDDYEHFTFHSKLQNWIDTFNPDDFCFLVRQCGLEVDRRFKLESESRRNRTCTLMESSIIGIPNHKQSENEITKIAPDPYKLSILKDRKYDPRWAKILSSYTMLVNEHMNKKLQDYNNGGRNFRTFSEINPKNETGDFLATKEADDPIFPLNYIYYRIMDTENVTKIPEETILALIDLFFKYGRINNATQLYRHISPTSRDLTKLVNHVRCALNIMPFAIDANTYSNWKEIIKVVYSLVRSTTLPEILKTHDILLGGSFSNIKRTLSIAKKSLFYRKYYNYISNTSIRESFDKKHTAVTRIPYPPNIKQIQNILNSLSNSNNLCSPVLISLVSIDDKQVGVLGVGKNSEDIVVRLISLPASISNRINTINRTYRCWSRGFRIPWGILETHIFDYVFDIAKSLNSNLKWILLALDPLFAGLPIQKLVIDRIKCKKSYAVVSLIPNISWLNVCIYHNVAKKPIYRLSNGINGDLIALKDTLEEFKQKHAKIDSLSIIMGHGSWLDNNEKIPAVKIDNTVLDLHDWFDLLNRRIVIIHSCYTGQAQHTFLSDLGGLPAIALEFGCKLFCAPVVEVPIKAAEILHKHLFKDTENKEIGIRYLEAIEEEPFVALYNLYGLANINI